MGWLSRWWRRPSFNINQALKDAYQKGKRDGIEIGKRDQPLLYGGCPRHEWPLHETEMGHYICPICRATTEPLPVMTNNHGDLARWHHQYLVERGQPPSEKTIKHRTIRLDREEAS